MELLKELWLMFRLLFTKVDASKPLVLVHSKYFPSNRFAYLMWCGKIFYKQDSCLSMSRIAHTHETIHILQAAAKKTWIRYYISYLYQWMIGLYRMKPMIGAYYTNPYEVEAYANEDSEEYLLNYNKNNIKKYYLRHRYNVYKEHYWHWKEFIKTI